MLPLAGAGLKLSHPTFAKPNMYSALLLTTGTLLVSLHASEATHTKIFVAAPSRRSLISKKGSAVWGNGQRKQLTAAPAEQGRKVVGVS